VTDGVFAQPVRSADGTWTIPAEITLANSGKESAAATVEITLLDPDGKTVTSASTDCQVTALGEQTAKAILTVKQPRLWSIDSPSLYSAITTVKQGDRTTDEVVTPCGFRTLRFDANNGFSLNDQPLKIQGVCNHQDHAGVGVAVPDALWDFRLRKLKEMGVNAVRCSHHPPAAEFLDACDRLGLLVMDEARNFNVSPEYIAQLEWMVRRDRNHPSVFLWSVFNEEPFQGTEIGYEMTRRMVAAVKRLDTTRPVTAAMSGGFFTPLNVSHAVDVMGFNYHQKDYDEFHKLHPTLPLLSSEDTSCFITRGEYANDDKRQTADSRDNHAARWGATHRDAWKAITTRPFMAGGFVWTGFDYAGEPTPFEWPSASSSFGIMDLCGFPKSAFYIHQAQWRQDLDVLELIPHWNWPGQEGKTIQVMALANAETVELFLNGKSLGEKSVDPFDMVHWDVPYEPGDLLAVGKKQGREVSRKRVETTSEAVALKLVPDRKALAGDGLDAMPVTVSALDVKGQVVPTAMNAVNFSITGPANIIGLGNGDPRCHEPQKGDRRSLFNGLAQVILQSKAGGTGDVILRAESHGLARAELVVSLEEISAPAHVSKARYEQRIEKWKASPGADAKPDPLIKADRNDINSWTTVTTGTPIALTGGKWSVFSAEITPFDSIQREGGSLDFRSIEGKATVWIDGLKVAEKDAFDPGRLLAPLAPGSGARLVRVLMESDNGKPLGFSQPVVVMGKAANTYHAQGELAGEPTANGILLQTRVTAIPGPELAEDGDVPGQSGTVSFEYSEREDFMGSQMTPRFEAREEDDFIVRADVQGLKPGTRYFYRMVFDDGKTGPSRSFRTLDPAGMELSFCMGNCMHYQAFTSGKANGGGPVTATTEDKQLGYPVFAAMKKLQPDFFIGAGDIVYYDFPAEHPAQTVTEMRKKWHEQFRFPRLVDFFASTPAYWLKDDHDFRFDDADQSGDKLPAPSTGQNIFREQMPVFPAGDRRSPSYRTHRVSKEVQLWFLEGRDYRSDNKLPDNAEKSIWGAEQLTWLEKTLKESDATWKIIITPTPMVGPDRASKSDNHTNPAGFRAEA
ncbi:MAG: glycoside hydrolase family 2 TIM barrel-domain containing protein, partial [Verrucomicrobiaceae bacterium]